MRGVRLGSRKLTYLRNRFLRYVRTYWLASSATGLLVQQLLLRHELQRTVPLLQS